MMARQQVWPLSRTPQGTWGRGQGTEDGGEGNGAPPRRSRATRAAPAGVAAAALAVVLALAGCGYALVGSSSNLPESLRTLYIAPFVNQTGRAELDQRLAEQVTQEWVRRARFQLVPDAERADAVMSGTVVAAVVAPVRFDDEGRATEYQLSVSADVQLVDRTGAKPVTLWRDQRFTRSVSYEVDVSAANYFDREVEAIDRLARDFARGLVVAILEGF